MKLNGLDIYAAGYTTGLREVALELIPYTREAIALPSGAIKGSRFNDSMAVLWRLESMFSEDDFVHDPIGTISSALLDAAKSDYWYTQEKDWGAEDDTDEDWESDAC